MLDLMKDLLRELKDVPPGYKGKFFTGYDFLENQDILKEFQNMTVKSVLDIFKLINKYETKHLPNQYQDFENTVIENIKRTNIEQIGYNIKEIGSRNAQYVYAKDAHILIPYLFLSDSKFRESHLSFENFEVIHDCLREGAGAVLSIFHWGMFQSFIPILISKKIKITFIANYYALMLLQGSILSFIPEYADYVDYIATGDPTIIKQCVNKLRRNEVIALLPELSLGIQKPKQNMNFMGTKIYLPEGPAAISILGRTKVIPCYIEEDESLGYIRYISYFAEPIEPPSYDKKYIFDVSKQIFTTLEKLIVKKPHYWCGWEIFHRMVLDNDDEEVR